MIDKKPSFAKASAGKEENIGVIFALSSAVIAGMFPILVNRGTQSVPPILFAAVTTLLAAGGAFFYAAVRGELHELKNKNAYSSLLMVTFFIVVIPYVLLSIGSSKTSGVNTSFLKLSEIIFTLFFTHFIGEKTTKLKLLGAGGVFIGSALILYNGKPQLNIGDVLIIFSTLTFPLGNFYAKKALNLVSPSIILFMRFLLGGIFILVLSFLFEAQANGLNSILSHWKLILFVGVISLGIGKVVWYEGLRRLDISKAISLGMTSSLFSLLFLISFFKENFSMYQLAGIVFIMAGGYFFL